MNNTVNIRELFSKSPFLIPIYQRNYAWETKEVKQLLQDIADYAQNHHDWEYFIGTLIVLWNENHSAYETIDGQQRLTTLYIILCALKNWQELSLDLGWFKSEQLTFDNRENSCRSLSMIYENLPFSDQIEYEKHIVSIYETIRPAILSICSDLKLDLQNFIDYLLSKVKILSIEIPRSIDKNHYFEVMNSRGVQLEQHEIVKADLMQELQASNDDMFVFGRIWDACSNMERYVQMNFYTKEREIIFGDDWTSGPLQDFDSIVSRFPVPGEHDLDRPRSLRNILETLEEGGSITSANAKGKNSDDRLDDDPFYSVINYQNFLLHVLKVFVPDKEIRLDDKQLSDTFLSVLNEAKDKVVFVKGFAVCLLKCRFLFDKYVVRRQNDRWCLKRLRSTTSSADGRRRSYYVRTFGKDDEEENTTNEETIMLLSMFHVSTPTMAYKNWLHGVLRFLYTNDSPSMSSYVAFLKTMAKAFMLDRYLPYKERMVEFMDIFYQNDCEAKNTIEDIEWSRLDQGTAVENFIFNYFDYLLWLEKKPERFEFSYRNSVEHFYPQHPSNPKDAMDVNDLNKFGNLCLISDSTNSKFSNNMPAAKLANFKNMDSVYSQSLKLQEMFQVVQSNKEHRQVGDEWTTDDIGNAEEKAINLFKKYLGN